MKSTGFSLTANTPFNQSVRVLLSSLKHFLHPAGVGNSPKKIRFSKCYDWVTQECITVFHPLLKEQFTENVFSSRPHALANTP